jgi:hypothetical protein
VDREIAEREQFEELIDEPTREGNGNGDEQAAAAENDSGPRARKGPQAG